MSSQTPPPPLVFWGQHKKTPFKVEKTFKLVSRERIEVAFPPFKIRLFLLNSPSLFRKRLSQFLVCTDAMIFRSLSFLGKARVCGERSGR